MIKRFCNFSPWFKACSKFLMWTTQFFLLFKLRKNFWHLRIFVFQNKKVIHYVTNAFIYDIPSHVPKYNNFHHSYCRFFYFIQSRFIERFYFVYVRHIWRISVPFFIKFLIYLIFGLAYLLAEWQIPLMTFPAE